MVRKGLNRFVLGWPPSLPGMFSSSVNAADTTLLTFLTETRHRQGSRTPVVLGAVILALKDMRAFHRTVWSRTSSLKERPPVSSLPHQLHGRCVPSGRCIHYAICTRCPKQEISNLELFFPLRRTSDSHTAYFQDLERRVLKC